MAIADTSNIIADWPAEGLPLRDVLALCCPFWPEHKHYEMLRYRMATGRVTDLTNSEKLNFVFNAQDTWTRVIEWLYDQLESRDWILKAYSSEDLQGEAKPFDGAVARRLSFEKDNDAIRGPKGQLFYGARIFSAATMAPKPKEPLHVRAEIVGTVVTRSETEKPHTREINARQSTAKARAKAFEACVKFLVELFRRTLSAEP